MTEKMILRRLGKFKSETILPHAPHLYQKEVKELFEPLSVDCLELFGYAEKAVDEMLSDSFLWRFSPHVFNVEKRVPDSTDIIRTLSVEGAMSVLFPNVFSFNNLYDFLRHYHDISKYIGDEYAYRFVFHSDNNFKVESYAERIASLRTIKNRIKFLNTYGYVPVYIYQYESLVVSMSDLDKVIAKHCQNNS